MKIIVSSILLQLCLKELSVAPDDNVEVSVSSGAMLLRQGERNVSLLIHCPNDVGPLWIGADSFISLERLLVFYGCDFPLILEFDSSRIWAHFYM